jgi:hypothetical protein
MSSAGHGGAYLPVIPATGEADRRIAIPGQAGPKQSINQSINQSKKQKISQVWWFTAVIPATPEAEVVDLGLRLVPRKSMRPYLKNKQKEKD